MNLKSGFTLIELSIVLVIIGLIVGGVLVGQDLIKAAEVRATISQLQKYNTATNTFRNKYGYLPGDIPDPQASSFGFKARGTERGTGDGNGILEGYWNSGCYRSVLLTGEEAMFWVDLSAANLIEDQLSTATSTTAPLITPTALTTPSLNSFMPLAKLGNNNYFYVRSQPTSVVCAPVNNGINFFGLMNVTITDTHGDPSDTPTFTLSVKQAYAMDQKIDDGLPQTGKVTAQFLGLNSAIRWASGTASSSVYGASPGTAAAASSTTCYDNAGSTSNPMQYSMGQNSGSGMNCALSFQMQ